MELLHVERLGGLAGMGSSKARIRSHGQLDLTTLAPTERQALDALFATKPSAKQPPIADGFQYRIVRQSKKGTETIIVPESVVPAKLVACVKDELV